LRFEGDRDLELGLLNRQDYRHDTIGVFRGERDDVNHWVSLTANEQRLSDAEPKLIAGTVVHVVG